MASEMPAPRQSPGDHSVTPTKDIKESIAALRSILMFDTPTKSLLSGSHPTVAAQQSRHESSRQNWDELATLRSKTLELKTKVQVATTEAEHETRKRKTLQTTYNALTKQCKELSVQLEIVTKSRDVAEEKLAVMRKSLNEERAAMAHERCQWRPQLEELKLENEKLETKQKDLETQCLTSSAKVRKLEADLAQLRSSLANVEAELRASQECHVKQVGDQNLAAATEKKLASVQEELNTIKLRHQKSLGSMLQIQQNLKKQLQQALVEKKACEDKLAKYVAYLEQSEKAKDDAIVSITKIADESERQIKMKMASIEEKNKSLMSKSNDFKEALKKHEETIEALNQELETVQDARVQAERELNSIKQDLDGKEEARQKSEEEARQSKVGQQALREALEKLGKEMKDLQEKQDNERTLPNLDLPEGLSDAMPSSVVALEQLIQEATKKDDTDLTFDFVRRLTKVAHDVKWEVSCLLSAKETAEARLSTAVAADETLGYELASARERLREARDKLMDSREEADQLRVEVSSLRRELGHRGTKRTPHDSSDDDSEEDEVEGEETENTGSMSKRLRRGDYYGTSDEV